MGLEQITNLNIMEAVLRPVILSTKTAINSIPIIDKSVMKVVLTEDADLDFSPGHIMLAGRPRPAEEVFTHFEPGDIDDGLRRLLYLSPDYEFEGKPIKVFSAFVGVFAHKLADIGFDVTASDILSSWVKKIRKNMSLKAQVRAAHNLPPDPALFSINFEGYPVILSPTAFLVFLREAVSTERGVITVESIEPGRKKRFEDDTVDQVIDHATSAKGGEVVNSYLLFGASYGVNVHIVDTPHVRFFSHELTPEAKHKAELDLALIDFFSKLKPDEQGGVKLSLREISRALLVTIDELTIAINRLSGCVASFNKGFGADAAYSIPLIKATVDDGKKTVL